MIRTVALVLFLPALALAHAVDHPRTIRLRAAPGRLEARFTFELDRAEAQATRRLFDRDRDGRLVAGELEMLSRYLERRALGTFELRHEGRTLASSKGEPRVRGASEAKENLAVEVHRSWTLPEGAGTFSVEDAGDAQGHVPVSVQADGVEVRFGAVKLGRGYDLPARTPVRLVITPRK